MAKKKIFNGTWTDTVFGILYDTTYKLYIREGLSAKEVMTRLGMTHIPEESVYPAFYYYMDKKSNSIKEELEELAEDIPVFAEPSQEIAINNGHFMLEVTFKNEGTVKVEGDWKKGTPNILKKFLDICN